MPRNLKSARMSKRRVHAALLVASSLGLAALAGCGGKGPALGRVAGKVTLNGQALEGVTVEFQPKGGSPSSGVTDASGRYELAFTFRRKGALPGKHTVRIRYEPCEDETAAPKKPIVTPLIPPQYNVQYTLTAEVKPGSNEIDFELKP